MLLSGIVSHLSPNPDEFLFLFPRSCSALRCQNSVWNKAKVNQRWRTRYTLSAPLSGMWMFPPWSSAIRDWSWTSTLWEGRAEPFWDMTYASEQPGRRWYCGGSLKRYQTQSAVVAASLHTNTQTDNELDMGVHRQPLKIICLPSPLPASITHKDGSNGL